jgi:hypothetical protein
MDIYLSFKTNKEVGREERKGKEREREREREREKENEMNTGTYFLETSI